MGKIILHFAVTLDGMVSNVEKWVSLDEEALQDSTTSQDNLDAIIFGKNSYPGLTWYWQQAETSSQSPAEREFARSLNLMKKYVLSHGEVELGWKNSELLRAEDGEAFRQAVAELKNGSAGEIWADAGEGLWRSFLEYDLWDGLDMLVHPLVLGEGKPIFASMTRQVPLRLVYSKKYANGVVNLRYERAD